MIDKPRVMDQAPTSQDRSLVGFAIDGSATEPFGSYFFASTDIGSDIARGLEREVFLEAFGNTQDLLHAEYDEYERASVFLCVIDHRRQVCAGMMRVILPIPGGPGLKSLRDVESVWGVGAAELFARAGLEYDAERSWDIATLAVARDYRSAAALGLIHIGLYQALAQVSRNFAVHWLVAILDYPVYRLLRMQLRRGFVAFGEERPYLGSARSVPACCAMSFFTDELRTIDPQLYELIYKGSALTAALRQVDVAPATEAVARLLGATPSPLRAEGR